MKAPLTVTVSLAHVAETYAEVADAVALADAAAMMLLDDNGEAPPGEIPRYERVVDMARAWAITRGWREPSPDDLRREEQ